MSANKHLEQIIVDIALHRRDSRTQVETVFERKRRLAKEREEMRIEQAKRDSNVVLAQRFLDAEAVNVELKT